MTFQGLEFNQKTIKASESVTDVRARWFLLELAAELAVEEAFRENDHPSKVTVGVCHWNKIVEIFRQELGGSGSGQGSGDSKKNNGPPTDGQCSGKDNTNVEPKTNCNEANSPNTRDTWTSSEYVKRLLDERKCKQ